MRRFTPMSVYTRLVASLVLMTLLLVGGGTSAQAQEHPEGAPPEPECEGIYFPVTMSGTTTDGAQPERLIAPPLPDNPTQLDCGAFQFAQVCMACHGDRGQGLTEEWRAAWGRDEENCWQSKCHASNHPPEGFDLPRFAPRIIGEGALQRFESAAELYNFISTQMPWHAPGSLDEKTYWQLVNFLASSNGLETPEHLTAENAPTVRFRPLPPEATPTPAMTEAAPIFPYWVLYAAIGTVMATGAAGAYIALRR